MKKMKLFSLIIGLLISSAFVAQAQLLEENFQGTAGDTLASGWVSHSLNATKILYKAGSLSYTNYPSNSDNSIYMNAGQDYNKSISLTPLNSGNLYCAMLVNIDSAKSGDHFFHTYRTGAGTNFYNRIYAKKTSNNKICFGILKGATIGNVVWSDSIYDFGVTHLLVLKVEIVSGTTNDIPSLIINPVISGTEPAATITATDIASTDYVDIDRIALRQGNASNCPKLTVDGIRVATTWADAVTAPVPSTETDILTFNFTSPTATGVVDPATHTVAITVPFGTNVTTLVPIFTLSTGANAKVATVPQVSGTTSNNFTSAVTYDITAQDGSTTQPWVITTTIAPASAIATLTDLTSGGTTVTGFAATTYTYNVELPYGTTVVPTVIATTTDANATKVITPAASLPGATTVVVTAQNGTSTQTYTINYTLAPASAIASLADLTSGGTTVTGFATTTYTYNVELPYGTTIVPTVTATTTDLNATKVITPAASLPGATTVVVTAQNGTSTQTYTINYTVAIQTYTVTFNVVGTNGALTATVDAAAITSPATVNAGKNVVFTATPVANYSVKEWKLDGTIVSGNTSNTYTLNNLAASSTVTVEFKLNVGVNEATQNVVSIYPNPANDVVNVKMNNTINKIAVVNMNGQVVAESEINNLEGSINTSSIANGMYFLRIETANGITMNKIQIVK